MGYLRLVALFLLLSITILPFRAEPESHSALPITDLQVGPNGRLVAIGRADGSVVMWDSLSGQRLWISHADWKATRRLGIGSGNVYSDAVVDLRKSRKGSFPEPQIPILSTFFIRGDLELVIVERQGGIRRVLADDGYLLGAYGVFFGVKSGKKLAGVIGADVGRGREKLAIVGSLGSPPYEVALAALEKTESSGSYIVLEDSLTRRDLIPGTSFVEIERLGIEKSSSASGPFLHAGDGHVTDLRYCDGAKVLVGVTDDGRLIGWKRDGDVVDSNAAYVRLAFRDGKGGTIRPELASTSNGLLTATPSGKYGNLQVWDPDEGELKEHFSDPRMSSIKGIAADSLGKKIATLCRSQVDVWQIEDHKLTHLGSIRISRTFSGQMQSPQKVAISADGGTIVVADRLNVFAFDLSKLTIRNQFGPTTTTTKVVAGP
jgi:WD40 repeat protein